MTYTVKIYFLGQYRPANFESSTLATAVQKAETALTNAHDRDWFLTRLRQAERELRKPSCDSWSSEHGCRGVSIAKRPHDPFIDHVTCTMPEYPGLDYSLVANKVPA